MHGRPASEDAASTARLETWGWLGAVLFPVVGVVIGIVLLSRPAKNNGGAILAVSAGMIVVSWAILVAIASQPTTY
jgi:CHASE2 domain-containing sensor protein